MRKRMSALAAIFGRFCERRAGRAVSASPFVRHVVRLLGAAAVVSILAAMVVGCAAGAAEDPSSVLRGYARALEDGRADDAYRMLSDEARRAMSIEAFRRLVKENPDEVREIAKSLHRPSSSAVITATVFTPSGQELALILENGKWKVDTSSIDLYAQDTPRHAVQGFVRALEHKRYDVILRYVPDSHREGLDAPKLKVAWEGPDKDEMAQVLTALKQAMPSAAIEETGDRATMAYGSGTMQLVREHGQWKIEDFD
jgi:hypothetical protein